MEERSLNVSFGKAGNGGRVARITIPVKWLDEMKITPEQREISVKLKDNKIIIEKK